MAFQFQNQIKLIYFHRRAATQCCCSHELIVCCLSNRHVCGLTHAALHSKKRGTAECTVVHSAVLYLQLQSVWHSTSSDCVKSCVSASFFLFQQVHYVSYYMFCVLLLQISIGIRIRYILHRCNSSASSQIYFYTILYIK